MAVAAALRQLSTDGRTDGRSVYEARALVVAATVLLLQLWHFSCQHLQLRQLYSRAAAAAAPGVVAIA